MSSRSVFPTELIRLILSDVAASFTEDQYEPVRDKGSRYTPVESGLKTCFSNYSLVCSIWYKLAQPYLHRLVVIRPGSGHTEEESADSVSLQEVLDLVESRSHLLKYVQHLRFLPLHRDTQLEDPLLLPQILYSFPDLRILELVNLDFTADAIQKYLCRLDSMRQKLVPIPIRLDRFAFHATPGRGERALPVNTVLFFLFLISEANSFLLQTDPKVEWSVYTATGPRMMVRDICGGSTDSIIPRRGCLKASSFSIKSHNLPGHMTTYLTWAQVFQTGTLTNLLAQVDIYKPGNIDIFANPAYPHLLEFILDLSHYTASLPDDGLRFAGRRFAWEKFTSLQKLCLKVPLTLDGIAQNFEIILELTIGCARYMPSLRSFVFILVDLEYARHKAQSDFRMAEAYDFAATLLSSAEETPENVLSLNRLEIGFEDGSGVRYETSQDERACVTDRFPNLHNLGLLCVL